MYHQLYKQFPLKVNCVWNLKKSFLFGYNKINIIFVDLNKFLIDNSKISPLKYQEKCMLFVGQFKLFKLIIQLQKTILVKNRICKKTRLVKTNYKDCERYFWLGV
jgi:hypothetical protein